MYLITLHLTEIFTYTAYHKRREKRQSKGFPCHQKAKSQLKPVWCLHREKICRYKNRGTLGNLSTWQPQSRENDKHGGWEGELAVIWWKVPIDSWPVIIFILSTFWALLSRTNYGAVWRVIQEGRKCCEKCIWYEIVSNAPIIVLLRSIKRGTDFRTDDTTLCITLYQCSQARIHNLSVKVLLFYFLGFSIRSNW